MSAVGVWRAPMRARDRDVEPPEAGAASCLARGLVGIGDPLPGPPPRSLDAAVDRAGEVHGAKAGRMLDRFASIPDGDVVWTRAPDGLFHRGVLAGPWRYDTSGEAARTGIVHVRPCEWDPRPRGEDEVPEAVRATFARGGRNLQRIRGV